LKLNVSDKIKTRRRVGLNIPPCAGPEGRIHESLQQDLPGAAPAQQKIVIKFGWASADNPTDPNAITAHEFKKAVEATTGGRIEVQLFPNRQLGDEKPMMEGMRLGTVDSATITNSSIAQTEPSFQIADLPFLFKDQKQAHDVLDGPIGTKLGQKLESKGIKLVGFMELGFRHMINNVRPVEKPSDVQGVKFRVMQNPMYIAMFSSLGGNAVPMAWGEMFPALQQGAIDGLEAPLSIIEGNKIFDMAKFLSLTNHTYSGGGILMSKRLFDRLSPELQKQVLEAGKIASKAQRAAMAAEDGKLIGSLQSKGMKVNTVADTQLFRAAMKPVYDRARAQVGDDLMNELMAAVQAK
jgi:tripartite ATP-independent transporter DctP family solute receptor